MWVLLHEHRLRYLKLSIKADEEALAAVEDGRRPKTKRAQRKIETAGKMARDGRWPSAFSTKLQKKLSEIQNG